MRRFLTIADGVAHANGRKIILSGNLPGIGDLDDALIRPGRCFARVPTKNLTLVEAERLLRVLVVDPYLAAELVARVFNVFGGGTISLAEVYQSLVDAQQGLHRVGIAA